ncbi:helix-turn-helix domain-containing protein [Paenibacillus sp. CAA11]|nr:helix-turn-helix transcriptional regulator [Paenibacillus sp. CAA11]
MAERSNLDGAYTGAVECGERNFSIDTLDKFVEGLNISPGE